MNYKLKRVLTLYKIKDQIASCTPKELMAFKANVKNICFVCGEKFRNSLDWYFVRGNCCLKCSVEVDRIVKEKRLGRRKRKILGKKLMTTFLEI